MSLLYFPPGYAPSGYFPTGYFPDGSGGATPPAAEGILSGVRAIFLASPSASALTKLYSVKADDDAALPYGVVREARAPDEARFSDAVLRSVYLEVKVYAGDLDAAGELGDALEADLLGGVPAFAGASVGALTTEVDPTHGHEAARGEGGTEVFWQRREFRCRVLRGS